MIIINCEQNTPEWQEARCGIPTASGFDNILTAKGKLSKQRTKYLYQLAGEILTGKPEETYTNGVMQRGHELEDEARKFYELATGREVIKVGFCLSDSRDYGASPDGLVNDDGGIEIKCPMLSTHIGYLLNKELPTDYFPQVQGQLLVTDRKWVDFLSYYPGLKPLLIRVNRNEEYINKLKEELDRFCYELKQIINTLKEG